MIDLIHQDTFILILNMSKNIDKPIEGFTFGTSLFLFSIPISLIEISILLILPLPLISFFFPFTPHTHHNSSH